MKDPTSQLRVATRRAKSDVANKLVSMFLHEISRRISQGCEIRLEGELYQLQVRQWFANRCPYCLRDLASIQSVVEHLDGMNRYRAGLHVPGNVLVACRECNSEKRRDDSLKQLSLGEFGWESFLSHDGTRCDPKCPTCHYWQKIWPVTAERTSTLAANVTRIRAFRATFEDFIQIQPVMREMSDLLTKLYSDCQAFAEQEIGMLIERLEPKLAKSVLPRANRGAQK